MFLFKNLLPGLLVVTLVRGSNIEASKDGSGSFCISKPPKRSILANCTSSEMCEYLLNVSPPASSPFSPPALLQCGDQGECVTNLVPQNEHCREACDSSSCASLCLQLYETKNALYCIETRDHPNALPPSSGNESGAGGQNKYYCCCLLPGQRVRSHHLEGISRNF